jgi:Ran GTPase-activating protein (RanGAP) involved in mRNA processing and transport
MGRHSMRAVVAMCSAIDANGSITRLDMSGNHIGPSVSNSYDTSGVVAVAKALRTKPALTFVDLSHNAIGPTGVRPICNMLRTSRSLKTVDLSSNGILPSEGGVAQNPTLQTAVDDGGYSVELGAASMASDVLVLSR